MLNDYNHSKLIQNNNPLDCSFIIQLEENNPEDADHLTIGCFTWWDEIERNNPTEYTARG